jgi:quercetin dioxygenase-like cupin family protein
MKKICLILLVAAMPFMVMAQRPVIESGIYRWSEASVKKESQRESRKIAEGSSAEFSYFKIHATTQYKGAAPRAVHIQDSIEELIIIKEGTVKSIVGDSSRTLPAGSVLLIPPGIKQQLENVGDGPLTYFVFQFKSHKPMNLERSAGHGGAIMLNIDSLPYTIKNDKGARKYFNRPTAMCENYEMHTTTLNKKGPSQAAHQHVDTEIILIVNGEAEMTIDGKYYKGSAGDFFIAGANTIHQVGNAGDSPCTYFAFKWR